MCFYLLYLIARFCEQDAGPANPCFRFKFCFPLISLTKSSFELRYIRQGISKIGRTDYPAHMHGTNPRELVSDHDKTGEILTNTYIPA